MQVNIKNLIDDVQCYRTVRELRWPDGVDCPACESKEVIKRGFDDTEPVRQRYECSDCHKPDFSVSCFQPVLTWVSSYLPMKPHITQALRRSPWTNDVSN